jgi:glycine cleavage system aminomethyltransferase T
VIARQITYDKITRRLTGVVLDSPVPAGTRLTAAKKPIGRVTSCVHSPRFGPIALAVLKRPHDEPGSEVLAVTDEGTVRGKVSSIPFG